MQKQHDNVILELTVRNHPGVMTHVCGLFARRAFNVEGILCLPIQGSEHSRIWLLVNDDQRLGQMISQIEKLEDEKEAAVREEAYEKAGEIMKKQEKLREKIAALLEKWQKEKETRRLIVSENEIAGRYDESKKKFDEVSGTQKEEYSKVVENILIKIDAEKQQNTALVFLKKASGDIINIKEDHVILTTKDQEEEVLDKIKEIIYDLKNIEKMIYI